MMVSREYRNRETYHCQDTDKPLVIIINNETFQQHSYVFGFKAGVVQRPIGNLFVKKENSRGLLFIQRCLLLHVHGMCD